jgi:LCP family protein required for cell wall assembly
MIDFKKKMEEEERQAKRAQGIWSEDELLANNKKRNRIVTYIIAVIVVGLVFSGRILISSQSEAGWWPDNTLFKKLKHLVPAADRELKGESDDRINVLLLGMGGEGHEGAYLTDTIMVVSLQPSSKRVAMISLPRDMVAPASGWKKINSINAYAEQNEPGSGGEITSQAIGEMLQIPIHYYVRVDFNSFSKIIDELGGIEIDVENAFDDYTYPISGEEDNPNYYARFEHLHFDAGLQTMDGKTALKYARSRHAYGIEGSDFARAKRQQLVLEAVKNKLLSTRTLLNPVMLTKLANEFSKDITTNLTAWEMLRFWDVFQDVDRSQIINKILSDAPDNFLVASQGDGGAYILVPRTGNFSSLQIMVRNIFADHEPVDSFSNPNNEKEEIPTISSDTNIVILNGTWITGLATRTSAVLDKAKFNILETGNAPERNYSNTVAYALNRNNKKSLEVLKEILPVEVSEELPAWISSYQTTDEALPDIIIVLGSDAE